MHTKFQLTKMLNWFNYWEQISHWLSQICILQTFHKILFIFTDNIGQRAIISELEPWDVYVLNTACFQRAFICLNENLQTLSNYVKCFGKTFTHVQFTDVNINREMKIKWNEQTLSPIFGQEFLEICFWFPTQKKHICLV